MITSVPNSLMRDSVPEIRPSFDVPKTHYSMGLDFDTKNRNESEAFLDPTSNNPLLDESESAGEENHLNLESAISKEQMRNIRSFVLSKKFPHRTAQTDQAVLIALIDESIIYVKGRSGVRPGTRKLREATNLNLETISMALLRLCSQGWVMRYSKGSRSGTASVWRVNFEKFHKFGYDHSFDYTSFNHPLAEHFRLWTKFGLGIKTLHTLNFLYQHRAPSGEYLSAKKGAIEKGAGYSWKSVTDGLSDLINLNLVTRDGNKYSINESAVKEPERFAELIRDYYSIDSRVEKREDQHKLERLASAPCRSMERDLNIQLKIASNLAKRHTLTP